MNRRSCSVLVIAAIAAAAYSQTAYRPTSQQLQESYRRADSFRERATDAVWQLELDATWLDGGRFWYLRRLGESARYLVVNARTAGRVPAFDHNKMAAALSEQFDRELTPDDLKINEIHFEADLSSAKLRVGTDWWQCDLGTFELEETEAPPNARRRGGRRGGGPTQQQGPGNVRVEDGQVEVREGDGEWTRVTQSGDYASARRSPDGAHVVAFKLIPGDHREVYLLDSSPDEENSRAVLRTRLYDQPGDKLDTYTTWVIDVESKTEGQVQLNPIVGGGQPWSNPPGVQWWKDGSVAILAFFIRGYQAYQVVQVEPSTGEVKILIDEREETFVDTTKLARRHLQNSHEIVWRSERDGWGHLYLIDGDTGKVKNQITSGEWVVRGIDHVDEDARQVYFRANGREPGQDPYHIHSYRVNLDGTGLVRLTEGDGTHTVKYSPDYKFLVDTWSRVDMAPQHVLRSTEDGRLVMQLERADISKLIENGVRLPERFVAKGRDGTTDIWGIVIRPSNWDPTKQYPVIEDIYAGPHDNFVPKSFRATYGMQALAELGFIVVKMDGMGTNNRGKAFHDVCWKNIADAGFEDRILWMKALAAEDSSLDISRVGVYGTSAGGQSSTGAVLFHPEFYSAAVSSCGCHDNRMDKMWWNEQWMGYPVGDHYEEQSNITNAPKLKGSLLLIVAELDTNVPPESTYRLAKALIEARKEFEFVLLPGLNHTGGGTYGERKRRDFFVRHLLGVSPPKWNGLDGT